MGVVTTKVSSFGRINTTFYILLKFFNEKDGENLEVCDFGCLDGLYHNDLEHEKISQCLYERLYKNL